LEAKDNDVFRFGRAVLEDGDSSLRPDTMLA
jgi:hypothetical protein